MAGNFSIDRIHSRITAGDGIRNAHAFYPRHIGLNLRAT
jgi:hypothetical protein